MLLSLCSSSQSVNWKMSLSALPYSAIMFLLQIAFLSKYPLQPCIAHNVRNSADQHSPQFSAPGEHWHRGNQFPSTLLPGYLDAVEATHTNLNVGVKGVKRRKRSFSEKWQPGSSGENPWRAEAWGRSWQDQGGSWTGSLWDLARQGWDYFPMLTHKLKSWHKRGAYIIPDM